MEQLTPQEQSKLEEHAEEIANGITISLRSTILKAFHSDFEYNSSKATYDTSFFCYTVLRGSEEVHEKFSQILADFILEFTTIPNLKSTPKTMLAKEIRNDVFEPLDEVRLQYVSICDAVEDELKNFDTSRSAVEGAVAGKILGESKTRSGNFEAALGAMAAAGHTIRTKEEIRGRLLEVGLFSLEQYFERLKELHPILIDYVQSKIIGEYMTPSIRQIAAAKSQDLDPDIQSAMDVINRLREHAKLKNAQKAVQQKSFNKLVFGWIFALIFLLISFLALFSNGATAALFLFFAIISLLIAYSK